MLIIFRMLNCIENKVSNSNLSLDSELKIRATRLLDLSKNLCRRVKHLETMDPLVQEIANKNEITSL